MMPELRLLFWELTARCNLSCRHCRAMAGEATAGELSTEELLQAAHAVRAEMNPVLILTGGEPLARPDFFTVAETCTALFSHVALATNGTLIDDTLARRIRDTGIQRVSISLDGARARTHDAFRGVAGSFAAAVQGVQALRQVGLSVQINVTATRHNEMEIAKLLELALELGADALHLFLLVPVGCGAEIDEELRLAPSASEDLLKLLYLKSLDYADRISIRATCAPQYFRVRDELSRKYGLPLPQTRHGMNAMTRGCLAGTGICFISRTGDVQPCGYLPLVAGNVRERALGTIWRDSELFTAFRDEDRLLGKCRQCSYRDVCSGCRARAYAVAGNPFAPEPDCAYQP